MIMFVIATILGQIAIVGRLLLGSMHLLHLLIATHTAGLVGGWMNLALWAGEAFPQFFGIEVTLLVSIATYLGSIRQIRKLHEELKEHISKNRATL